MNRSEWSDLHSSDRVVTQPVINSAAHKRSIASLWWVSSVLEAILLRWLSPLQKRLHCHRIMWAVHQWQRNHHVDANPPGLPLSSRFQFNNFDLFLNPKIATTKKKKHERDDNRSHDTPSGEVVPDLEKEAVQISYNKRQVQFAGDNRLLRVCSS